MQKALETAKEITTGGRETFQARLLEIRKDFARQGESQRAVEYISHSVQILESTLSSSKRTRGRPPDVILALKLALD